MITKSDGSDGIKSISYQSEWQQAILGNAELTCVWNRPVMTFLWRCSFQKYMETSHIWAEVYANLHAHQLVAIGWQGELASGWELAHDQIMAYTG